jgi:myo-inositol-1(or 4)-monophosphatase
MSDFLKLAMDLARAAGAVQMEHLHKVHKIEFKDKKNLVTEVDKQCERLIVDGIRARFPDHDVLGEEGEGERKESDYLWIIDPLDGTTNYAHQFPFFDVSIGLSNKGELICGVIYDPNRDELFAAEKGKGAALNGKPVHASKTAYLKDALMATGFAYVDHSAPRVGNVSEFEAFVRNARAVRRPGAAAIDLAYVACGRLDGFWEPNLKPWDMAAGALIIAEAGGKLSSYDGGQFDLYGTEIVASNGLIHNEMITVLNGSSPERRASSH